MDRTAILRASYPDVTPIPGERDSYYVQSHCRSSKRGPYLVRLSDYNWNGACACLDFATRKQPWLERGAFPSEELRCFHIRRARAYHLDIVGPAIDRLNEPQPLTPERRRYYQRTYPNFPAKST